MLATAFVIQFPNGDFEYDVTHSPVPSVGETFRRKGVLWLVTQVTREIVEIVHVERVDTPQSKQPYVRSG